MSVQAISRRKPVCGVINQNEPEFASIDFMVIANNNYIQISFVFDCLFDFDGFSAEYSSKNVTYNQIKNWILILLSSDQASI